MFFYQRDRQVCVYSMWIFSYGLYYLDFTLWILLCGFYPMDFTMWILHYGFYYVDFTPIFLLFITLCVY